MFALAMFWIPLIFLVVSFGFGFLPRAFKTLNPAWQVQPLALSMGILMASTLAHQLPETRHLAMELGVLHEVTQMACIGIFVFLGNALMIGISRIAGHGHGHGHGGHGHGAREADASSADVVEMQPINEQTESTVQTTAAQTTAGSTSFLPIFFAMCFHSFMEGMPMGVTKKPWALFVGLICHKIVESVAVGSLVVKAKLDKPSLAILAYAICTPLGVVAGAVLNGFEGNLVTNWLVFSANALTVGAMLFMVFSELPSEIFTGTSFQTIGQLLVAGVGFGATISLIVMFDDHDHGHSHHHHD